MLNASLTYELIKFFAFTSKNFYTCLLHIQVADILLRVELTLSMSLVSKYASYACLGVKMPTTLSNHMLSFGYIPTLLQKSM